MNQTSGIRELDSVERYSKYAVLPQNPWLLNGSGMVETLVQGLVKVVKLCLNPYFSIENKTIYDL